MNTRFEPLGIHGQSRYPDRQFRARLHRALSWRKIYFHFVSENSRSTRRERLVRYSGAALGDCDCEFDAVNADGGSHSGPADHGDWAALLRVRYTDGAERQLLQVRELRRDVGLQLSNDIIA